MSAPAAAVDPGTLGTLRLLGRALRYVAPFRARFGIHERVVEDEVSLLDALQRPDGPQLWIARSGTYQCDPAFRQFPTPRGQRPNTPNFQCPTLFGIVEPIQGFQ